jgi:glycosyltransferase involved in cell wall biosynthesis
MKVMQFSRKRPTPGSIEILFSTIRKFLPNSIEVENFIPSYESQGLFKRLYIIGESFFNQADVNHITGDIHFVSLLLNKKNTILTVHDAVSVVRSKGIKRAILKFFWFTLPLKKVKFVTVISEKTKYELLELVNFPENRIFVIPDCISDKFKHIEQVNFNKAKPRILQIGTKNNKNIIRVCEALKGIPCVLDIVGKLSNEQLDALQRNHIDYEVSVNISEEKLIRKYIDADIVAFVSTYEGFGMPTLEAQTVGRAVLTSNISPMIEVAGEGACLVDPLNVDDIHKGFKKLIVDDEYRKTVINEGLMNCKKYDPQLIAKEYAKLYTKIYQIEGN